MGRCLRTARKKDDSKLPTVQMLSTTKNRNEALFADPVATPQSYESISSRSFGVPQWTLTGTLASVARTASQSSTDMIFQ